MCKKCHSKITGGRWKARGYFIDFMGIMLVVKLYDTFLHCSDFIKGTFAEGFCVGDSDTPIILGSLIIFFLAFKIIKRLCLGIIKKHFCEYDSVE